MEYILASELWLLSKKMDENYITKGELDIEFYKSIVRSSDCSEFWNKRLTFEAAKEHECVERLIEQNKK